MEKLLEISQKLERLVNENDLVGEFQGIIAEYGIESSDSLKKVFTEKMEKDRDLKIGILGRVKAGKSSFLNAIVFKGQNVLPKAATPMTAALTILEYGNDFEALVDFYSKDEIEDIKSKHQLCKKELVRLEEQKFQEFKERNKAGKSDSDLREMSEKFAINELKTDGTIYAYYEQYERILKSGINYANISNEEKIIANSYDELNEKLKDYVGSNGKYMPFTKSISLRLNEDMLKDVKIIDTPGINDPIVSREQRTRELIAECDAVFLVSPCGQFLANEDLRLLNNINKNNGIKEFHIIASQFDNALSYPEIIGNKVFPEAIERAKVPLQRQQQSVFNSKKDEYGEEICRNFLDFEVLYNSGISIEIINNLGNLQDENQMVVFDNLKANYPDFFTSSEQAKSNLEKLSNIENIYKTLEGVRTRKDKIIKERRDELIASKRKALNKYKGEIVNKINNKKNTLLKSDMQKVAQQISDLNSMKSQMINIANDFFEETANILSNKIKEELKSKADILLRGIDDASENSIGSKTEERTRTIDKGRGILFWRSLTGNRYETQYYTVDIKTVNAGMIRNQIQEAIIKINDDISSVYRDQIAGWKTNIRNKLKKELQNKIGNERIEPDIVDSSVDKIITEVSRSLPDGSIDSTLPAALRKSGLILGESECDKFLEAVDDYTMNLKSITNANIKTIVDIVYKVISSSNIGTDLAKTLENDLKDLADKLSSKEQSLARYNSILEQLEQIK